MAAYITPIFDSFISFPLILLNKVKENDSLFGLNDIETTEDFYPYLRVEYRETVSIEFYSEIRRPILYLPYMSYSKIPGATIDPLSEARKNIYAVVKSHHKLSPFLEILMLANIRLSSDAIENIDLVSKGDFTGVSNMPGFEIYAKNTNQMEDKPFEKSNYTALDYLYYYEKLSCIAFCKYIDSQYSKFLKDENCNLLGLKFTNFLSTKEKMKETLLYSDFIYVKTRREKDVTIGILDNRFHDITFPPQRNARETFFQLLCMLYQKIQNGCVIKKNITIENPLVYPDVELTSIDLLERKEEKEIDNSDIIRKKRRKLK